MPRRMHICTSNVTISGRSYLESRISYNLRRSIDRVDLFENGPRVIRRKNRPYKSHKLSFVFPISSFFDQHSYQISSTSILIGIYCAFNCFYKIFFFLLYTKMIKKNKGLKLLPEHNVTNVSIMLIQNF